MMRVSQRLFLAVLPAVLGVFTVVGLAYFGEYSRQAPEWLVVVAAVASLGSLGIAWYNARYVAQRIEQLAASRSSRQTSGPLHNARSVLGHAFGLRDGPDDGPDELDTIEGVVDRLTSALTQAKLELATEKESLERRRVEYAQLVASGADEVIRQIEEVRLPLHILLENHFGELNENQEEMLGAARNAAEGADKTLLQLRQIANIDLGTLPLREDPVSVSDVLASLLPALRIEAEERDVWVELDAAPALPTIGADRGKLQEALVAICRSCLRRTPAGASLLVSVERENESIRVAISGAQGAPLPNEITLPLRLVRAHGGTLDDVDGVVTLRLPIVRK